MVFDDAPDDEPMFGQLPLCVDWLLGAVWLFGVVLPGFEAAMATAPQVPAAATATTTGIARSNRFDFSNRFSFLARLETDVWNQPRIRNR